MSRRTAAPTTSPATLTAVDADGDDFALDFGMTILRGVTPARAVEIDKAAAAFGV